MKLRLPCQGFIPRAKGAWNSRLLTGSKEPIPKKKTILGERDEKTARFFDTVRGDLSENFVFGDAFFCSFWIGYSISSAAMKKSMIPTRGTGGKIPLLNQNRRDPPQR
jgi:hypothetical protein